MNQFKTEKNFLTEREFEASLKMTLTVDRLDHMNIFISTNFGKVSISGSGSMDRAELLELLETNPNVDIERTTISCPFHHRFVINTEQKRST